jgi:SSS family solute:Na+ symporter/sodium/pantothenate symporter
LSQVATFTTGDSGATAIDDGVATEFVKVLEITSPHEVARIVVPESSAQVVEIQDGEPYKFGAGQPGVYVRAPGPSPHDANGFLPLGLAISFYFYWTFSGAGQPSNMVRLMSFNSTTTLRRAMVTVAIYFSLIYFPLVVIFCCARVLLPGMEIESDRIMPAMAEHVTRAAQVPWLAGLLVAAPFAAVMSTVDSFLLMISSAIVRDVYQRDINPRASEASIRRLTYATTVVVGMAALLGALNPPRFLQDIIVFTGGGLSASFLLPVALTLYWPRFNAQGAIAGMLGGFVMHVVFHGIGWWTTNSFRPYKIADFDPFIPELIVSLVIGIVVTLLTPPPSERLARKFFDR